MKKISVVTLIIGIIALLSTAITYGIVLPEMAAKQYISDLRTSATDLRKTFEHLAGSTDTPLLNNLGATPIERQAGTDHLKKAIDDSRAKLTRFASTSKTLQMPDYPYYAPSYAEATTYQQRAQNIVVQTTESLNQFEAAVAFLEIYTNALSQSSATIDSFNQTDDLNTLIGQSNRIAQSGALIQTNTKRLEKTSAPTDLVPLKTSTLPIFNQASTGFTELAHGLIIMTDEPIYRAASKIEAAGMQIDDIDHGKYATTIEQSRTLQNVHDLNEKLDPILP